MRSAVESDPADRVVQIGMPAPDQVDEMERLGQAVISELAAEAGPGCPPLSAAYGKIIFYEMHEHLEWMYLFVKQHDGQVLSLGLPSDIRDARELWRSVFSTRGPVIAIIAPAHSPEWEPHDGILVGLCVNPDEKERHLELVTCGRSHGIGPEIWGSKIILGRDDLAVARSIYEDQPALLDDELWWE